MKKVKSNQVVIILLNLSETPFPCEYRSLDICEAGPKVCTMQGTCLFPAVRYNGTLLLPGKLSYFALQFTKPNLMDLPFIFLRYSHANYIITNI